jgi:putative ABC transport system ATP-binding protein
VAGQAVLEFQDVSKVYTAGGLDVWALRNIDLAAMERDVVVIMGPSGAGKTTFLTIAGALMRPTSGRVAISGTDVTGLDERRLPRVRQEKIGFIFQNFNLLETLSAAQNVELVMATRGITGKAARARAEALLREVGVEHRQQNVPKMLSGAIARALANNPDLILADEPTANLDSRRGREIMELLRMVAKELGKTVVTVSHDLRIRDLADRALWLEDGHLQELAASAPLPGEHG